MLRLLLLLLGVFRLYPLAPPLRLRRFLVWRLLLFVFSAPCCVLLREFAGCRMCLLLVFCLTSVNGDLWNSIVVVLGELSLFVFVSLLRMSLFPLLKVGRRKGRTPRQPRERSAADAAARLMEKIVPGAPAIKPKASKKDQHLLKRRDDGRAPAPAAVRAPGRVLHSGRRRPPPSFPSAERQAPLLPSSSGGGDDGEFLLQRRTPLPAGEAGDGGATADEATAAAPKKAASRKRATALVAAAAKGKEATASVAEVVREFCDGVDRRDLAAMAPLIAEGCK